MATPGPSVAPVPGSALAPALAARIVAMILRDGLPEGRRLTEQRLCAELGVSRSPVRKALQFLEGLGAVKSEPNKGYRIALPPQRLATLAWSEPADSDEALYMAVADRWLDGGLPSGIAEADLMQHHGASRLQVQRVLNRMAREGVVERKAGRGWVFLPLLNSPQAHHDSFRFRMVIEPAALLEPGYTVDAGELDKCHREQVELLGGGIERWTRAELFRSGVHLHETIIAGARNPMLLDALRKVNQLRRLVEYRSKVDRSHMRQQCEEHLELIALLRRGELAQASVFMRAHLEGAGQRKAGAGWPGPRQSPP